MLQRAHDKPHILTLALYCKVDTLLSQCLASDLIPPGSHNKQDFDTDNLSHNICRVCTTSFNTIMGAN
jgi:hypothetical protein